MKNRIYLLVFLILMVVMSAGCASNETLVKISTPVPNAPAGTPAAGGQINIPGFNIQVNTPGPNPLVNTKTAQNEVAGIVLGIWHGVISPITLVVSFVNPSVQMYEVHNDGSQYNLGFLVGVAIIFLILGATAGSRRR